MTPEDKKLWEAIKGTVKPLKHGKKVPKAASDDLEKAPTPGHTPPAVQRASLGGQKTVIYETLDKTLVRRLRKGTLTIEGRLDLHGMRQKEALEALRRFVAHAQAHHKKLVLIITGKGAPQSFSESASDDGRRGVLRQMLPEWVGSGDVQGMRSLSPALPEHGGTGAFYAVLYQ